MAGLRIGYLYSSAATIQHLNAQRDPHLPTELSKAAACAALQAFESQSIAQSMQPAAAALAQHFVKLAEHPAIDLHRALGMIAMCRVREEAGGDALARKACALALERGLFTRPLGSVLYLWPPLVATPEEIEAMCAILGGALADAATS